MLPNIPKSIVDLANETASKPVASFSEFISIKLFGKSIAKLKAEAANTFDQTRQTGEIQREVNRPFIVEIETAKAYRQYSNLGSTLQKATPLISSASSNITDDNDVFWGLLEHAKEISNEKMQELIAKIIAGEYNNPETYSMCTLQIIKSLGKREIELFEKMSSLLVNGNQLPQVLFTGNPNVKDLMSNLNLDFGSLQTLQSLGLVLPNEMTNTLFNPEKKKYQAIYFDEKITFECSGENTDIQMPGYYGLSTAGGQILKHLKPQKNEEYFNWLKINYNVANYKILS